MDSGHRWKYQIIREQEPTHNLVCEAQARLLTSAVLLRGSCAGPGDEFKINEQILAVSPPNNGQTFRAHGPQEAADCRAAFNENSFRCFLEDRK